MFLCMCIPVFIGELYISDAVINNRINVYNTQVSPAFAYRVRYIYGYANFFLQDKSLIPCTTVYTWRCLLYVYVK